MALNITNLRVEQKAIQASLILGVNKTAAVEAALDYYLKIHKTEQDTDIARKEVARLFEELAALPILDDRKPDDILAYNELGLP